MNKGVETKPWYLSHTMWAAIFAAVVAISNAAGFILPNELYILAGAWGLWGVRKAKTKIE